MENDLLVIDKTHGFPPEIMTKIFKFVSGGEVLIPPPEHGYPWLLGYVNSRWRAILWSSPSLWNNLIIGYPCAHIPTNPVDGYDNLFMERYSVRTVLSYILEKVPGPISFTSSDEAYLKDVMQVVMENLDRFVDLLIDGLSQDSFFSLFKVPAGAFSRLEKLSLTDVYVHGHPPDLSTSPLEKLPNLRSVTFDVTYDEYIPALFRLPWATIEDISVEAMATPLSVIWDVFRSAPLLKSCSFYIDNEAAITSTPRITLPNLTTLKLEADEIFDWEGFFGSIVTPSLQSLALISPHIPCTPLASLVTRSRCSITKLDLYELDQGKDANETDLELIFQHFSLVTHIRLPWCIPPHIFTKIRDGVFPNLENVRLSVYPDGLDSFLDMLDSYTETTQGRPRSFELVCHRGYKFWEQLDRYLIGYEGYQKLNGLSVKLIDRDDYSTIPSERFEWGK